jgi:hypothetical protein
MTGKLLYSYYVDYYHWDIPYNNPSGIRVEKINNEKILTDNYDKVSQFFTVKTQDNKIIATARICDEINDLLEIECYLPKKHKLKKFLNLKKEYYLKEFNREAIDVQYIKDENIYLILLNKLFQHAFQNNFSLITTTVLPEWEKIYVKIGLPLLEDMTFKYFEADLSPAKVYFASVSKIEEILENIKIIISKDNTYV